MPTLAESLRAIAAQAGKCSVEEQALFVRIAELEAEVSRLRKLAMPFHWNSVVLNFTQGSAASINLATFLVNPQALTIVYAIKAGSLPAGCTLSGSTVAYNGSGAVAATSVQFSATSGQYVADSAVVACNIIAAQGNRAPVWSVADNYALPSQSVGVAGSYSVGGLASDPDGDTVYFARTGGTAAAGVTVSNSGLIVFPNSLTAGSYTLIIDATDANNTVPTPVTGLSVASVSYSTVRLTWLDLLGESGYYIERSPNGSTWTQVGQTAPDTITFTDGSVTAATTYYYRVRAYNAAGNGGYSSTVTATTSAAPTGLLADWTARSTGAGVIWAHRFTSPGDPGCYWASSPVNFVNQKRTGYLSTSATQTGPDGLLRSAGGVIPGDGCIEQYTPANVTIEANRWTRPLVPTTGVRAVTAQNMAGGGVFPGYTPNTTVQTDLAQPWTDANGVQHAWQLYDLKSITTTYPGDPWNAMAAHGGGFICNPSDYSATPGDNYQRLIPANPKMPVAENELVAAPPDGFYIQYRIKFPVLPNGDCLLDYTQDALGDFTKPYRGAWQGKSWLCHAAANSNIFCEVGSLLWGYSTDATTTPQNSFGFAPILYGQRADWLYTNGPQVNTTQGPIQGEYSATCAYQSPGSCWKPQRNKWITMMVHIVPGSQNVSQKDPVTGVSDVNRWLRGDFGALIRNQAVEFWVADEGATQYTKLLNAQGYASQYSGRNNGSPVSQVIFGDRAFSVSNLGGDILITVSASECAGLFTGCAVEFQRSTTTSLPTGVPNAWPLYAIMVSANTFKLAATKADALAGTAIVYTDSGTITTDRVAFSCAPGYSVIQFDQQMNLTSASSPYGKPSWILYDQIICSTQFIPCPAV